MRHGPAGASVKSRTRTGLRPGSRHSASGTSVNPHGTGCQMHCRLSLLAHRSYVPWGVPADGRACCLQVALGGPEGGAGQQEG